MKKISLFLVLVALVSGCSIVELDTQRVSGSEAPIESEMPNENRINLGSQTIPADVETAMTFLQGETSKTWEAEEFIIEGMGFVTELTCRLDDAITLNADGSFDYESGQWSCGGEEGEAQDRNGGFSIVSTDQENFVVSFTNVDGFDDATFEGRVLTLEENVLVVTANYENNLFGTFTITGRYTAQ